MQQPICTKPNLWILNWKSKHFKKNERLQVHKEKSSIYIKNISNSYSKIEHLKNIFAKIGKIVFGKVFQDSNKLTYAIIVYVDAESRNVRKLSLSKQINLFYKQK